jgi:ATP-dependent DNA helicase RecG
VEALELLDLIANGETSRVQFKEQIDSNDRLMMEMAAFSNCRGGRILVGIQDKTGEIIGLTPEQLADLGSRAANIANDRIKPSIFIYTEVITVDLKRILVIEVCEGTDKPYYDNNGIIWTKNGPDKRRVTDNNELARLMAEGGNLSADEMPVKGAVITDLNMNTVFDYCRILDEEFSEEHLKNTEQLLENLHLYEDGVVNLAGLLLFGNNPQQFKPVFCVKAVSYFGNDIEGTEYRSSKDIQGDLARLYEQSKQFLLGNLRYLQKGQGVNAPGRLEISEIVIEELLVNALMHRDYFKNAPVRLLVFDNRVEIISPGKLPNNLTVENIKSGNAAVRNNVITSVCSRIMPYRGLGSGVLRAIKEQPRIGFINDIAGEQFTAIIPREL